MNIEMQEKAFRNEILPLKEKFYRMALRITLDSAEAEDIVQDTLIRIWEKRDEWPSIKSFEALGLTICRNLAIDRSERKEAQNVELIPEQMDDQTQISGPHEEIVANESMKLIWQIIDELPVRQREVLQLRDIEGMTYKEIAAILQITEDQVKITLFRARQSIKKRFKEIDDYGL